MSAVKHDGKSRDPPLDLLEDVEAERRWNEHAAAVAGALLGLNFMAPWEVPMEMASESTPVLLTKSSNLLRFGIRGLIGNHRILDAGQHAELAFHRDIILACILHHLLRELNVVLVGVVRAVDHDR